MAAAAGVTFGSAGSILAASVGGGGTTPTAKPVASQPSPSLSPTQVKVAPVKQVPAAAKAAAKPQLKCGNLATLQARVRCRLELSPEEVEQEYAVQYLPEECRAIAAGARQSACVEKYKSFQPCWEKPVGDERVACAQQVLGLTKSTDELVRQCRGQRACQLAVQDKVYDLIKFRFYELEERAEELLEAGAVDVGQAATLVAAIEEQKAAFNAAEDNRERQQVVYAVRRTWQEFVDVAKRADR